VALVLLLAAHAQTGIAANPLVKDLQPQAQDQIRLLQDEKRSRSWFQQKLDSQLVYALRQKRFGAVLPGVSKLRPKLTLEPTGLLLVDLRAQVTPRLLESIGHNGGTVVNSFPRHDAARAVLPLEATESLAKRADVQWIRPADQAITSTTAVEGDIAHRADQARQAFAVDGTGVKIGVLSDGTYYLTNAVAEGNLPPVTVLPGQGGELYGSEGTAMLEIVHSLAPGAGLYFATAFESVASFAQNIRNLQAAGCRIIVDDVLYFNESPFQDGPIAQAVNDVSAAGVLFFSCAGNGGGSLRGTSGTWEGDFKDGGLVTIGDGGRVHDFGGTNYNTVLPGGTLQRVDLFWADPLGNSTNDYDVYVLDSSGSNVVRSATNPQNQNGHYDPYESIPFVNNGERIVVVKYSGADRYLYLSTCWGRLQFTTPGGTHGHNASGAANAFCVAATRVASPSIPFVGGTNNPVEYFSSDGPRRMFFTPDGTAITPGDYSSTGGMVLQKPDLTAADGVNTTVPGFAPFYGTSAAAPHAAAIAALVWAYNPTLSTASVRSILTRTSLDIADPGPDQDSGAGIVMAYPALADLLPVQIASVQLTDANGNGSLDPNECAEIVVTLTNLSGETVSGLSAVLGSPVPEVTVDPAPRSFPDLPPGGTNAATTPFRISTSPLLICGTNVGFVLQLASTNQATLQQDFQLGSGYDGAGVPLDFSSTNVPLPIPDLGTVESSLTVAGVGLPLAHVKVSVHITHDYADDLRFSLVGPDGTAVLLSSTNRTVGADYGASCDSRTVFSDDATNSIDDGFPPFVGTFAPQEPLAAFYGKTGSAVNGVWMLRVSDQFKHDEGTLQCWSLELTPIVCFDGGGECLVPPVVTAGPSNTVAANGATVALAVQVEGPEPLSYQWVFNETNVVAEATNATLVLSPVVPGQAGSYAVVASNPYGSVTSAPVSVVVVTYASNRTVELGTAWDFDAPTVTGTNAVVSVLTTVTNPACGECLSATRTWLVSDELGNQVTCSQTVAVVDTIPPIISCDPDLVVAYGSDWAFDAPTARDAGVVDTFVYDNSVHDLLYRFDPGPLEVGNEIVLAASARYASLFSFEFWGFGPGGGTDAFEGDVQARVRFYRNDGPPASGYASPGTVIFDSGAFPIPATPAGRATLIFDEFQVEAVVPLTTPLPDSFTWTVQFSGMTTNDSAGVDLYAPPVTGNTYGDYWEHETNRWALKTNSLPMEFASRLYAVSRGVTVTVQSTVTNATCGNGFSATRTWQATDACENSASCSQTVQVVDQGPPVILSQPQDVMVVAGQEGLLEVGVSSCPPLGYQWYHNQTNVVPDATNAILRLMNIVVEQAGSYAVVITNGYASVTSSLAVVTVEVPARILSNPMDVVVTNGGTAELTVQADGSSPLFYQWYFNATSLLIDATNAVLQLSNAHPAQTGSYVVVVTNAYGSATSTPATLTVFSPPVIVSDPQAQMVTAGGVAVFVVSATGNPLPSYQWFFNGINNLPGANSSTLTLTNVQDTQAGQYSVVVSNLIGSATGAPAALVVLNAPAITVQPVNITALQGDTVVFSVTALGKPPLAYQWYADCTRPISGSTDSTLKLKSVTPTYSGNYCVTITNSYGSTTSQPATLRVLAPAGFVSITRSAEGVLLTFTTVTNLLYTVYASDELIANEWTLLPGAYLVLGTGAPKTVLDPYLSPDHRYYKVVVE